MSKKLECPLCGSTEICNVYLAKSYEYIKIADDGESVYSYTDEVEDFLHSTCDSCGATFGKKIEDLIVEV